MANIPIGFVNLIGGNDGVIFDGASIVSDCLGKIVLQAPPFEEFFGTVDLDCGVADERCLPGDDVETVRSALVLGIHDYARKNRFTIAGVAVVVAISGVYLTDGDAHLFGYDLRPSLSERANEPRREVKQTVSLLGDWYA